MEIWRCWRPWQCPTRRGAARLHFEETVPTRTTSSQPEQQDRNRKPCGLRGWKLMALFLSVLNGSSQPRLRPARQCGSLAKPLRSGLIRRRAMLGSCAGKWRLRPQTHPLGRSQRNSPQQRARLPGVGPRPNRESQPTRAPRLRTLSRLLPPSCRRRKGASLRGKLWRGKHKPWPMIRHLGFLRHWPCLARPRPMQRPSLRRRCRSAPWWEAVTGGRCSLDIWSDSRLVVAGKSN